MGEPTPPSRRDSNHLNRPGAPSFDSLIVEGWEVNRSLTPRLKAPCAGGDHFVVCDRFAQSSRRSARTFFASPSEHHAKRYTSHEVTAARAGRRPAGQIFPEKRPPPP